jgi:hypothetical protein
VVGIETDPVTGEKTAIIRNTRIFLTPNSNIGLYGPKIVYYDRIHATDLPDTTVTKGDSLTVYDVLLKLNIKTGLGIKETDVFDGPLPAENAQGIVEVPLAFRAGSVVFYGTGKINAVDYQFGGNPNYIPAGTVFGSYCYGTNLMRIVADGGGGVLVNVFEVNSAACPLPMTGPAGLSGMNGVPGPIGLRGPAGSNGSVGQMGPIGIPGIPGMQGIPGPAGPAGPAGAGAESGSVLLPPLACSDELSPLVVDDEVVAFHWTIDQEYTRIWIGLTTPQAGGVPLTVDVKCDGISVFAVPITIDNGEQTSLTANVPAVLLKTQINKGQRMTVDRSLKANRLHCSPVLPSRLVWSTHSTSSKGKHQAAILIQAMSKAARWTRLATSLLWALLSSHATFMAPSSLSSMDLARCCGNASSTWGLSMR